jgi:hypothetical protein
MHVENTGRNRICAGWEIKGYGEEKHDSGYYSCEDLRVWTGFG